MVSLVVIFWMYVILFGVIGAMRGWAREILVSCSVIVALAFITLLEKNVPFIKDTLVPAKGTLIFWLRCLILVILVFFGYQTPNIARLAPKMTRERLEHAILGAVIGAINGYLIAGSIWFYMAESNYPFSVATAPAGDFLTKAKAMLDFMPPHLLGTPGIYFALVAAFIFVIVIFI
jgi:hypothetical protein